MNLRRKTAVTISALAMTIGGGILTAPPAAADIPCPSDKMCLYGFTLYRQMYLSTGSVSACWWLDSYGLTHPYDGIMSYRNNLSVKATLFTYHGGPYNVAANWTAAATIASGGSSSNTTGGNAAFFYSEMICTGTDKPWL